MAQSILIPSRVFPAVHKRLSRLAKKAGVAFSVVEGESRIYRRTYQLVEPLLGRPYRVLRVDETQVLSCSRLTVESLPCTNGFRLIGRITHTEAGNLLALAPGARDKEIPAEWRDAEPTCDHCGTVRRRQDTFLVETPAGEVKRVGRNCLADFLMADPAGMIALAEFQDVLREVSEGDPDETWGGSGGWGWEVSPLHFLACAFSSVAAYGFVKRNADGCLQPSADHALFLSQAANAGRGTEEQKAEWKPLQPTSEHYAQTVSAIVWLDSAEAGDSDYIHNLRVAMQMHEVSSKTSGLIASIPTAFGRYLGLMAEKKAREALPDAGYLGTIGERVDTLVTVTRVSLVESSSRWTAAYDLIAFRTDEGHEGITFSTSSASPKVADIGKRFTVRGTVKKQEEYKGRKNTQLSRCIWTEEE